MRGKIAVWMMLLAGAVAPFSGPVAKILFFLASRLDGLAAARHALKEARELRDRLNMRTPGDEQ